MRGRRLKEIFLNKTLLWHGTLLTVPILAFTATLMGLIYYYEWSRHHKPIEGLSISSSFYKDVYYVDLSATRLILVASWSSSLVLTLLGSFMTLLSFTIATDVLWSSDRKVVDLLPSPLQLALMVDLLDGKPVALWRWLKRLWSDRRTRTTIWMLEALAAIQLFAFFLRYDLSMTPNNIQHGILLMY